MASGQKRQWESGARQFLAKAALQLGTHLAHDGGWNRIPLLWDVIELFSTDAHVSVAVSSAGGRATQPYDGGLGNSLRTPAAREQLFQYAERWKPRLIVAYLPDWTPGVSKLALELVRRQGREILLRYPLRTSMPLPLGHAKAGLHLVCGTLDGRAADTPRETTGFRWATTTTVLAGRLNECAAKSECI